MKGIWKAVMWGLAYRVTWDVKERVRTKVRSGVSGEVG